MTTFMFVAFWLFLCVIVGMFAHHRRNRNGVGWFLVAFCFSPLVAFLLVAVLRESDGTLSTSGGPSWLLGTSATRPVVIRTRGHNLALRCAA
jgi:hypothetical protein